MPNTSSCWAALLMLWVFGYLNPVIHSIARSNTCLCVGVQSCCVQQEGWLGRRRGKYNLFVPLASFHEWLTLTGWGLLFVEQWLLEKCRTQPMSLPAAHGKGIILIYFCQGLGMSILPRLNLLFILIFFFPFLVENSALPVVPLFPLLAKILNGRVLIPAWDLSWHT